MINAGESRALAPCRTFACDIAELAKLYAIHQTYCLILKIISRTGRLLAVKDISMTARAGEASEGAAPLEQLRKLLRARRGQFSRAHVTSLVEELTKLVDVKEEVCSAQCACMLLLLIKCAMTAAGNSWFTHLHFTRVISECCGVLPCGTPYMAPYAIMLHKRSSPPRRRPALYTPGLPCTHQAAVWMRSGTSLHHQCCKGSLRMHI